MKNILRILLFFKRKYYTGKDERWGRPFPRRIHLIEQKKVETLGKYIKTLFAVAAICSFLYLTLKLFTELSTLQIIEWYEIFQDTGWTFLRVVIAVFIATLWTTPAAIWISRSPCRLRVMQPLIQLAASFPAPMLYPLVVGVLLYLKIDFEISSMLLMLMGVQWYILFNVLAGALRIPAEIHMSMRLMGSTSLQQWRYLYIPSVLPALVTGWVTAAGAAWNASIVSELVLYKGQMLRARGLGALISEAAEQAHLQKLAACLTVMVVFVVILNKTVWSKLYKITQARFRMDL